eukprot:g30949.t1
MLCEDDKLGLGKRFVAGLPSEIATGKHADIGGSVANRGFQDVWISGASVRYDYEDKPWLFLPPCVLKARRKRPHHWARPERGWRPHLAEVVSAPALPEVIGEDLGSRTWGGRRKTPRNLYLKDWDTLGSLQDGECLAVGDEDDPEPYEVLSAEESQDKAAIWDEAVETACAALAVNVLKGNVDQVDALMVVLKSMMPPIEGAEKVRGPPPEATLEKSELVWSEHDPRHGPQENLRVLQSYEAEYARRVAFAEEGFRDPKVLAGALDLAVAYLKNYAVDKADALYAATKPFCMERGLPWDVKWLQDCATLRCKQQRMPEAAVMLEEVAKRTPPHPATLNNLGTVYNMMRDHEKAQEYFIAAQEVAGHDQPDKNDLWSLDTHAATDGGRARMARQRRNMGIAKKHLGYYDEALPMLLKALEAWKVEEPDDDVTIAKLHDTVGSCFDLMGRYEELAEGLTKALMHAGRYQEGFDRLEETFLNQAQKDAIHPTPVFELLGLALEEFVDKGGMDVLELTRLEKPMEIAVKNMVYRGLDQDGNAGVVFERMAQLQDAARRRQVAKSLLGRSKPLVDATTRSGEADLTHISALIDMELQVLETQDSIYRRALDSAEVSAQTGPFRSKQRMTDAVQGALEQVLRQQQASFTSMEALKDQHRLWQSAVEDMKTMYGSATLRKSMRGRMPKLLEEVLFDTATSVYVQTSWWEAKRRGLEKIVDSRLFEFCTGLIIAANIALIGVEAEMSLLGHNTSWATTSEQIFLTIYTVELFLRAVVGRWSVFRSNWFLLDLVLVVVGLLALVVIPIFERSENAQKGWEQILIIRGLRLLRLARVLRMVWRFKVIWRLVSGLLTAWDTMVSTTILISIWLYIFGCVAIEVITADTDLQSNSDTAQIVDYYFSSLPRATLTLIDTIDPKDSTYIF